MLCCAALQVHDVLRFMGQQGVQCAPPWHPFPGPSAPSGSSAPGSGGSGGLGGGAGGGGQGKQGFVGLCEVLDSGPYPGSIDPVSWIL